MFVLGNFVIALAKVLNIVLTVFYWLVLIRAVISWISPDPSNPIVQFLHKSTDFILDPIRRLLPPLSGIDFSPLIAFLIILFAKDFLVRSLLEWGYRLQ